MLCAGGDGLWWNLASGPHVLSFSLLLGWLCTCKATFLRDGGIRASSTAISAHYQAWEIQGEGRVALSRQRELLREPGARFRDCIGLLSCMFCWCLRPTGSDPSDLPEAMGPLSFQNAVDLSQDIQKPACSCREMISLVLGWKCSVEFPIPLASPDSCQHSSFQFCEMIQV